MPSTLYRLALDGSTARGSVALVSAAGVVRWTVEIPAGRGHGGRLFLALQDALQSLRETGDGRLEEIVVGLGPGSYSGVRQAVAAAIGLAAATGARLVGVPSPAALETPHPLYQAVGDARRGAFYYSAVEAFRCVEGPELLPDADGLHARLATRPDWPVLAVENVPPGLRPETTVAWPLAARLCLVPEAARRPPPLEPIYLRPVSITLPAAAGGGKVNPG